MWNSSAPTGWIFMKYDMSIYQKSVQKIQVALKADKNYRCFIWKPIYIFRSYFTQLFLEWEMFQTEVVEKIKLHFTFNNFVFEVTTICEIIWKNTVRLCRVHMTIEHIALCVGHRRLQIHSQNMKYLLLLHCNNVTLYVHCHSCWYLIAFQNSAKCVWNVICEHDPSSKKI
jgi:hypothetical protein